MRVNNIDEHKMSRIKEDLESNAKSWEPNACLIGNVRASEVAMLCTYIERLQESHERRGRLLRSANSKIGELIKDNQNLQNKLKKRG